MQPTDRQGLPMDYSILTLGPQELVLGSMEVETFAPIQKEDAIVDHASQQP